MDFLFGAAAQARLTRYFDQIGTLLGRAGRRASFATYALGLFGESERKSVEPIAARACADPEECGAEHDRLLHFLGMSPWEDGPVREHTAKHAIEAMTAANPIQDWIIDDTGMPKQGDKSPGVQRQYSGTLGKVANCQVAVSLTVATRTQECPIDMDLFLPESWANDRIRCRAAHIPDDVVYRPKWRIALDLIERNLRAGIPAGLVLADTFYGDAGPFRDGVGALHLDYAVDVKCHTRAAIVGSDGSVSETMTVAKIADVVGARSFRTVTWREGTKAKLAGRFAAVRVQVVTGKDERGEEQWLIIERPDKMQPPAHYVLATLPKSMSRKQLVRRIKQRWRTERAYEDLKGELGFDHFEGRSYRGWHHHITCALACYAFLVAERARAFPPSPRRSEEGHALSCAA